jgi:hypothetical protein
MQAPEGPIDPVLARAYQATHYVVEAQGGAFTLRVGAESAELGALMRARGIEGAAYLTAYNPWSLPRGTAENDAAQRALEAGLAALGCTLLPGAGHDPSGHWPPEPSVLALGLSLERAIDAARRWGQNAFVWIDRAGEPCRLVFTRPVADAAPHTTPTPTPTHGDPR